MNSNRSSKSNGNNDEYNNIKKPIYQYIWNMLKKVIDT